MARTVVLEGTWDEVKEQAEALGRRSQGRRLKLIVLDEEAPLAGAPLSKPPPPSLTAAERRRILDAAAERNRGLPVLPDEAFERESIYENRW